MRTLSVALVCLLCAGVAVPAFADNDKGRGNGPGNAGNAGKADRRDDDSDRGRGAVAPVPMHRAATGNAVVVPYQQVIVVDHDRSLVQTYYRSEYAAGRCPPGLAKKNNGCLPPGQAKKMWRIGQPLPPGVAWHPIQRDLWTQLTPPPYGYDYVQVDDNIVLMATTSRVIAALLGNIGRFD